MLYLQHGYGEDEAGWSDQGHEPGAYGAPHASELPYIFRQLTEHGRPAPTPKDEALSDMMRTYWTNFVKTGDPNGTGLSKWPACTDAKPQMLHIEAGNTRADPLVNENGLKVLDGIFCLAPCGGSEADHALVSISDRCARGLFLASFGTARTFALLFKSRG